MSANPLELLLEGPDDVGPSGPSFRWAVIVSNNPLRIRYDTETDAAEGTPFTLVSPSDLLPGSRVLVLVRSGQNSIIFGVGGGGVSGFPSGAVIPYAGSALPAGWLRCEGGAVSRSTYSFLYAQIGEAFGVGDGLTTFNLPDFRERVPAGVMTGSAEFGVLGAKYGTKTHTLLKSELPNWDSGTAGSHSHGPNALDRFMILASGSGAARRLINRTSGDQYGWVSATQNDLNSTATTDTVSGHTHVVNSTGGNSHNNVQPSLAMRFIIKY